MVVTRGRGRENGELCDGYRVSVLLDKKEIGYTMFKH